jgi:RimJ/RimL family protein N-acetyltransferase
MIETMWGTSQTPRVRDYIAAWTAERIWNDNRRFSDACVALGVLNEAGLVAGVVFHNYDEAADIIEISGASESKLWLTRHVLNEMFRYAFDDIGCQMVVQRVSENNKPIQRIFKSFGYNLFYIPRLRGRDEGEYICTLTAETWASHKVNRANA